MFLNFVFVFVGTICLKKTHLLFFLREDFIFGLWVLVFFLNKKCFFSFLFLLGLFFSIIYCFLGEEFIFGFYFVFLVFNRFHSLFF